MGIIPFVSRGGEMVDAHVLGACGVIHGGSSPLLGTKKPSRRTDFLISERNPGEE